MYVADQAATRASGELLPEGNLIALRELALRRTAERVEAKMRGYKAAHGIEESWHTGERVLVCVSREPPLGAPRARRAPDGDEPPRGAHRLLRRDPRVDPDVQRRSRAPRAEHAARRVARRRAGHAARRRRRGRDGALRAQAQRDQDRRRQADPPAVARRPQGVVSRQPGPPEPGDRRVRHLGAAHGTAARSRGGGRSQGPVRRPLRLRRRGRDRAHRRGLRVVSLRAQRARRRRHGVPARRRARLDALRVRTVARRGGAERPRVRLLLRAALLQLRGHRSESHRHLRGHVPRGRRHQRAHQANPRSGRQRREGASGVRPASTPSVASSGQPPRARRSSRRPRGTFTRCSTSRWPCCSQGAARSSRSCKPTRARSRRATRISASPTGYGTTSGPPGAGPTRCPLARALFVPLMGSRGRVGVLALFPLADSRLDDPDERQLLHTIRGPHRLGARAHGARRRGAARRAADRDRAAPKRAPQLRLARLAHAPRGRDGGHERPPRGRCPQGRRRAPPAADDGARRGAASEPPGAQSARHDAPRGWRAEGAEGAAAARRGRRRRRSIAWKTGFAVAR